MPPSKETPTHSDGFTAIANQLMEALARTNLTDYESRCLFCLLRRTYGWNKKADVIAYGQWAEATQIERRHVFRTLSNLVARKIIEKETVTIKGKNPLIFWRVQENCSLWNGYHPQQLPLVGLPNSDQLSPTEGIVPVQLAPIKGILEAKLSPNEGTVPIQVSLGEGIVPVQVSPNQDKLSPGQGIDLSPNEAHTKEKKETIQKKKEDQGPGGTPADFSDARKKVFEELTKRRGYNSPHAGVEAQAITWMLKQGYSVKQIMTAHDNLKDQPFWAEKFLNMQSIKAQIGEIVKGSHKEAKHHGKPKPVPGNQPAGAFADLA